MFIFSFFICNCKVLHGAEKVYESVNYGDWQKASQFSSFKSLLLFHRNTTGYRDIVQIQILDVRLGTKANTDEPLRQTVIRQNIVGRKVLARAATTLRRLGGKFKVSSFDGN